MRQARSPLLLPGLAIAAVVILVDQIVKAIVLDYLGSGQRAVEVTSFFNLVLVWNRGVSFGLFAEDADAVRWALTALALGIAAVLAVWLARTDRAVLGVSLGLIIGGAIGNAIDRIRFGAVADFLDVHLAGYHWPAFNVADSAITVGVVTMLADSLFGRHGRPQADVADGRPAGRSGDGAS